MNDTPFMPPEPLMRYTYEVPLEVDNHPPTNNDSIAEEVSTPIQNLETNADVLSEKPSWKMRGVVSLLTSIGVFALSSLIKMKLAVLGLGAGKLVFLAVIAGSLGGPIGLGIIIAVALIAALAIYAYNNRAAIQSFMVSKGFNSCADYKSAVQTQNPSKEALAGMLDTLKNASTWSKNIVLSDALKAGNTKLVEALIKNREAVPSRFIETITTESKSPDKEKYLMLLFTTCKIPSKAWLSAILKSGLSEEEKTQCMHALLDKPRPYAHLSLMAEALRELHETNALSTDVLSEFLEKLGENRTEILDKFKAQASTLSIVELKQQLKATDPGKLTLLIKNKKDNDLEELRLALTESKMTHFTALAFSTGDDTLVQKFTDVNLSEIREEIQEGRLTDAGKKLVDKAANKLAGFNLAGTEPGEGPYPRSILYEACSASKSNPLMQLVAAAAMGKANSDPKFNPWTLKFNPYSERPKIEGFLGTFINLYNHIKNCVIQPQAILKATRSDVNTIDDLLGVSGHHSLSLSSAREICRRQHSSNLWIGFGAAMLGEMIGVVASTFLMTDVPEISENSLLNFGAYKLMAPSLAILMGVGAIAIVSRMRTNPTIAYNFHADLAGQEFGPELEETSNHSFVEDIKAQMDREEDTSRVKQVVKKTTEVFKGDIVDKIRYAAYLSKSDMVEILQKFKEKNSGDISFEKADAWNKLVDGFLQRGESGKEALKVFLAGEVQSGSIPEKLKPIYLAAAIQIGDVELCETFLDMVPEFLLQAQDHNGDTLLQLAANSKNPELFSMVYEQMKEAFDHIPKEPNGKVELKLRRGVGLEIRDWEGKVSIRERNVEVQSLLDLPNYRGELLHLDSATAKKIDELRGISGPKSFSHYVAYREKKESGEMGIAVPMTEPVYQGWTFKILPLIERAMVSAGSHVGGFSKIMVESAVRFCLDKGVQLVGTLASYLISKGVAGQIVERALKKQEYQDPESLKTIKRRQIEAGIQTAIPIATQAARIIGYHQALRFSEVMDGDIGQPEGDELYDEELDLDPLDGYEEQMGDPSRE